MVLQHCPILNSPLSLAIYHQCKHLVAYLKKSGSTLSLPHAAVQESEPWEESVIPTKHVKVYANNKPWVTSSLKQVLMKKHSAFHNGDEDENREATKEVRAEIKRAKLQYKNKIEERLGSNNLKAAWDGVKRMTGLHKTQNKPFHIPMYKSDSDLSEALNTFFSRFDIHDFSDEHKKLTEEQALVKSTLFSITQEDVRSVFKRNKVNKSPGPDGITGRLLKCCSEQLNCSTANPIFEVCLQQRRVPKAWKESIIVPVAKSNTTKSLNDFRPVALTSLVMKSFEKIVKCLLLLRVWPWTQGNLHTGLEEGWRMPRLHY